MKRREMMLVTSGLAAGLAIGCSDDSASDGNDSATGGSGTGTGGAGTGGDATGGAGTGGDATGGAGTGGDATGGAGTGGDATGGAGTGGDATGGAGTGGDGTGGDASGGSGGGGGAACATVTATDTHMFHQHVLTVSPADVAAGVDKTYQVSVAGQGAGHPHSITITAAHFATLASTGEVEVTTSPDNTNHTHLYEIVCAR